jgi:transcriptional regulator with XRE-family HTH domain
MADQPIGARIAHLREFRGMTQEQLAERAGVHVDTVRKLEQGRRATARITTLRALALALDVELDRLLGQPVVTPVPAEPDAGEGMLALRDAIQDLGALLPGADADPEDPPPAAAWMATVREATSLYWSGRYADLAVILPPILRDGRLVTDAAGTGPEAERVWAQMALAYQLAASLAVQAGHPDWAWQAVERQLAAAGHASDPLLAGMGVSTLSWVLLRQGRWEQAQAVAMRRADELEPSFRRASPAQLAVYGNLLTAAATPAARRDRPDEAHELLLAAEAAAVRSGPVRAYGTAFSPADVRTQRVNIALAGRSPDAGEALRLAAQVEVGAIARPVHVASHRLDVAHAHYQAGDADTALTVLLEIEQAQPEWIKYQTLAATTVREMVEDQRRRSSPLRDLASRLGVEPVARQDTSPPFSG